MMIKNVQMFNIRETAEKLVHDRFERNGYMWGLLIVLVMIAMISLLFAKLPAAIPLYFTLPWGEARLAPRVMLYLLPAFALIFIVINLLFGRVATKLSPLLPRMLGVGSFVVCGMMLIALFGIIQSLLL